MMIELRRALAHVEKADQLVKEARQLQDKAKQLEAKAEHHYRAAGRIFAKIKAAHDRPVEKSVQEEMWPVVAAGL